MGLIAFAVLSFGVIVPQVAVTQGVSKKDVEIDMPMSADEYETIDSNLSATTSIANATVTKIQTKATQTTVSPTIQRKHKQKPKAKHNRTTPSKYVSKAVKSPLPVIVMGMPKAGTSSIAHYFQCGLGPKYRHRVSHYDCKVGYVFDVFNPQLKAAMPCGARLMRNADAGIFAFENIDHFDIFAQIDASLAGDRYFLPQISYTKSIYQAYPNATWILNRREPHKWLESMNRWRDIRERFVGSTFKLKWFGVGVGRDDEDMLKLYNYTLDHIRNFVADHPSITLVEVPVDEPDAGTILENAFGLPRSCWGQHNMNTPSETDSDDARRRHR